MEFNKLVPELSVSNLEKSLEFYKLVGFEVEYERSENKFAFVSFQGSQLMLEEDNENWKTGEMSFPRGRGINFQIEVDEIDEIITKLKENNISLFKEKMNNCYKVKEQDFCCEEFLVQDPDGYLLRFSKSKEGGK